MTAVAAIAGKASESGDRWSAFVTSVVESAPFRMRRGEEQGP